MAILWGQVEFFVERLMPRVSGLSWQELETLGVAAKPIASKVAFLSAARKRLKDDDVAKEVQAFCDLIQETKTARNHVFHGIWGWRGTARTERVEPAARKQSTPKQPFKAAKLPDLERKLAKCSRMGADLCAGFWGWNERARLTRFFHHDGGDNAAPKWLLQWSERNPVDDAVLDRSAKEGQLLRLSALFPQS